MAYKQFREDGKGSELSGDDKLNVETNAICREYIINKRFSRFIHIFLSLSIIVINYIFYMFIIPAV